MFDATLLEPEVQSGFDPSLLEPEQPSRFDHSLLEPEQPTPLPDLSDSQKTFELNRGALAYGEAARDPGLTVAMAGSAKRLMQNAGDLTRAGLSDVIDSAISNDKGATPSLNAFFHGQELPNDVALRELSRTEPNLAIAGKIGQGVVATAPLLAMGALPAWAQRLASIGFTIDMIHAGGEAARVLGEELGKNPQEQNQDVITSAKASLLQTPLFASLAGVHGLKDAGEFVQSKVAPKSYALDQLNQQLRQAPIESSGVQSSQSDNPQAGAEQPTLPPSSPEQLAKVAKETVLPLANDFEVVSQPQENVSTALVDTTPKQPNPIIETERQPTLSPEDRNQPLTKGEFSDAIAELQATLRGETPQSQRLKTSLDNLEQGKVEKPQELNGDKGAEPAAQLPTQQSVSPNSASPESVAPRAVEAVDVAHSQPQADVTQSGKSRVADSGEYGLLDSIKENGGLGGPNLDEAMRQMDNGRGVPADTGELISRAFEAGHAKAQGKSLLPQDAEGRADLFWKTATEPNSKVGLKKISSSELKVGQKFRLRGKGLSHEELTVTHIDPDTGAVTVKDGDVFRTQELPDGVEIYVTGASGSLQEPPVEPKTSDLKKSLEQQIASKKRTADSLGKQYDQDLENYRTHRAGMTERQAHEEFRRVDDIKQSAKALLGEAQHLQFDLDKENARLNKEPDQFSLLEPPTDDFSFSAPESIDEQKARLKREAQEKAAKEKAQAQRDYIQRGGDRLTGKDIDTTKEMFGAEVRVDKSGQQSLFESSRAESRVKSPPRVVEAISKGSTVRGVLKAMADSDHPLSRLAQELLNNGDATSLNVRVGENPKLTRSRWFKDGDVERIEFDPKRSESGFTVLEEVLHGLTALKVQNKPEFLALYEQAKRELGYDAAKAKAGDKVHYYLADPREFVAGIFSSPKLLKALDGVKMKAEPTTLWGKIKATIARALGIKDATLLDKVLQEGSKIVGEQRDVLPSPDTLQEPPTELLDQIGKARFGKPYSQLIDGQRARVWQEAKETEALNESKDKSDAKDVLQEPPGDEIPVSKSEFEDLLQRAWNANLKDYYDDGDPNDPHTWREWVEKDDAHSIGLVLDSDYELYTRFQRLTKGNDDLMAQDVVQAYKDGKLPSQVSREKSTTQPISTSDIPFTERGGIGEPTRRTALSADRIKAIWQTATQRATKKNTPAVIAARKELLIQSHVQNLAETLGLPQAKITQSFRSWSNYPASARDLAQRINSGVPEVSQWTGIENSSFINKATVSPMDVDKMVKAVEAPEKSWNTPDGQSLRRYIVRAFLAIDTRINYKDLSLKVLSTLKPNGLYQSSQKLITIRENSPHTVAHEIGHYLDHKWALESGVDSLLSDSSINQDIVSGKTSPQRSQWNKRFQEFVADISDRSDIGSEYLQSRREVFARFIDKFVRWTEEQAGGRSWGDDHYRNDRFHQQDFTHFVNLLQEKAFVDANDGNKLANTQAKADIQTEELNEPPQDWQSLKADADKAREQLREAQHIVANPELRSAEKKQAALDRAEKAGENYRKLNTKLYNDIGYAEHLLKQHSETTDPYVKDALKRELDQVQSATLHRAKSNFNGTKPVEKETNDPFKETVGDKWRKLPVMARDMFTEANDFTRKQRSFFQTLPNRDEIAASKDAADNKAMRTSNQAAHIINHLLNRSFDKPLGTRDPLRDAALTFVIETGNESALSPMAGGGNFDKAGLETFRNTLALSQHYRSKWAREALAAIDYAEKHWDRLTPVAEVYKGLTDTQNQAEQLNGIDTLHRKGGYVFHLQDVLENWAHSDSGGGGGAPSPFRHIREHATYADAIAAGVSPKSLNAVDLLQRRIALGQKLINYRNWQEGLKKLIDPATELPIATDVSTRIRADGKIDTTAPYGYELAQFAGQTIALHKGYTGLFNALTGESNFRQSAGWQALMHSASTAKHAMLLFDTFHFGRLAFWNAMARGDMKAFSHKGGLTLLDSNGEYIKDMARRGELTQEQADQLLSQREDLDKLMNAGLNVGNIGDNLYSSWVQKLPIAGQFNKWLFEKFQRGAMAQVALLELAKQRKFNVAYDEKQLYRNVAKAVNVRFGNLQSQGWIKSKFAQDLARLAFLAPQWNESLIRAELGAMKDAGVAVSDLAQGKLPRIGLLGRAAATAFLGQFMANQIINYATRGKPTWQNEEEGMDAKLSAWVPDFVGKSSGFFLNPLTLPFEMTHLFNKSYERTGDMGKATVEVLKSRFSSFGRAADTFIEGRNRDGETAHSLGGRVGLALGDAAPLPLSGGAVVRAAKQVVTGEKSEKRPGEFQRQAMQSFGVKPENAPTANSRMISLAQKFNHSKGIFNDEEKRHSPYAYLDNTIAVGNEKAAKEELAKLLETKTARNIAERYRDRANARFTGRKDREIEFVKTLTPEQKETYTKALNERRKTYETVIRLLK